MILQSVKLVLNSTEHGRTVYAACHIQPIEILSVA